MIETVEPPKTNRPSPEERSAKLASLIQEQGVEKTATVEHLEGLGQDLWASDEEFDEFLAILNASRAEKE